MSLDPDPTTGISQRTAPPGVYAPLTTNGFAIASLILGIVGLTWFPLIPSILALVFGYKGRNEIDRSGGTQQGRGLAVAGIVLGWIAIVLIVLVIGVGAVLLTVFAVNGGVDMRPVP
jgi:hypothetical protein